MPWPVGSDPKSKPEAFLELETNIRPTLASIFPFSFQDIAKALNMSFGIGFAANIVSSIFYVTGILTGCVSPFAIIFSFLRL